MSESAGHLDALVGFTFTPADGQAVELVSDTTSGAFP